jgi:hypothetical protein
MGFVETENLEENTEILILSFLIQAHNIPLHLFINLFKMSYNLSC